jgi:hypothetical protein
LRLFLSRTGLAARGSCLPRPCNQPKGSRSVPRRSGEFQVRPGARSPRGHPRIDSHRSGFTGRNTAPPLGPGRGTFRASFRYAPRVRPEAGGPGSKSDPRFPARWAPETGLGPSAPGNSNQEEVKAQVQPPGAPGGRAKPLRQGVFSDLAIPPFSSPSSSPQNETKRLPRRPPLLGSFPFADQAPKELIQEAESFFGQLPATGCLQPLRNLPQLEQVFVIGTVGLLGLQPTLLAKAF